MKTTDAPAQSPAADPADAPTDAHRRAAHIAQVLANLARTRAENPAYADAVPALETIAAHLDAAALVLINDRLGEFDGVQITNAMPTEVYEEMRAVEAAIDGPPAATGFTPGLADIVSNVFFA